MVHLFDPDPEQEINLKEFEADLQASLDSGWVPTWKNLEIRLSDQEIQALPTKKLAEALFRSGLPARTLLLFNHSHVGIKRLEMLYPGYAELFRRPDIADGLNAIIAMRIDQLISGDPDAGISISAGIDLGTIADFYSYPTIFKIIDDGHKAEIISAHIQALQRIDSFLEEPPAEKQTKFSRFPSVTAFIHLGQLSARAVALHFSRSI